MDGSLNLNLQRLSRVTEREVWYESATRSIEARVRQAAAAAGNPGTTPTGVARGVVLFVGDGMGLSTLTAARILSGQRHGNTGEEAELAWDTFPAVALARVSYHYLIITSNTAQKIWTKMLYT